MDKNENNHDAINEALQKLPTFDWTKQTVPKNPSREMRPLV